MKPTQPILALLALLAIAPAAAHAETTTEPTTEATTDSTPPAETTASEEAAPPAEAPQAPAAEAVSATEAQPLRTFQARNQNLEYAKELVKRGRYKDALAELDAAAKLPGNSLRIIAELHATRAQALLLKEDPDEFAARGLIVEMLHVDPEATMLADAPPEVRKVVDEVRAEQVLVLHDRIVVSRAGRPMRVRVKLVDPRNEVTAVKLHYRGNHLTSYSMEPMQKSATGWVGYVRDPSLLAPAGVTDEYLIDYYITAENHLGDVVDSNGSAAAPITTEISATRNEESGLVTGVDLTAIQSIREGPPPEPEVVVEPVVPIYKRWYVLTGAGVLVAGAVIGTVLALSADDELPSPRLGTIQLP